MRIYRIRNVVTGDLYVGSESTDKPTRKKSHLSRLRHGRHHSPYLQNAFNKYGECSFVFETVEDGISAYGDLIAREQHYIDTLHPAYNAAPAAGCLRGFKRSEATKRKHSQTISGRKLTADHRARIGAANAGKVRPPELRARWAAIKRGRRQTVEHRRNVAAAVAATWASPEGLARRAALAARNRARRLEEAV